ncbi:ACN9-domain-containing protein [Ceraceosorus guamensis]|uniref:Succinate dehydrogenase assembly factor 3 n=1 Tax=Ceraceosorus guamensis TaxID=1522189 RepID=A0A316VZN1_9BASI|nr:ACN9-domain-containing protein [Ceraceosorus guamensis]PWN43046.1 ACN9-domain-containing protein [Ceraceosorus guamensis]
MIAIRSAALRSFAPGLAYASASGSASIPTGHASSYPRSPLWLRCASQVATPSTSSHDLGLTAAALLPPLKLLRRILRSHRKYLDANQRSLGDAYVKDEFRRHRSVDQPLQIVAFLAEWKKYLDFLDLQHLEGGQFKGRQLDEEKFKKLSDEQLYQLHEFMVAAKEVYDPLKAKGQPPGGARAVQEAVDGALKRAREEEEAVEKKEQ